MSDPQDFERANDLRELRDLRAEVDRLREALERIADDDCGTWDQAMRYARSVLASALTAEENR